MCYPVRYPSPKSSILPSNYDLTSGDFDGHAFFQMVIAILSLTYKTVLSYAFSTKKQCHTRENQNQMGPWLASSEETT
jgi:hypothetical protein